MEKKTNKPDKQNSHQYKYKIFSCSVQRSTLKCISTLGLAPPAESNPTDRTTQYVTRYLCSPPPQTPPALHVHPQLATATENTMHIRQRQSPSDVFLTQTAADARSLRNPHPRPSHHVNMATRRGARSSATWECEVKPVQLQILSSSLKYMAQTVNQNVQFFEKVSFLI